MWEWMYEPKTKSANIQIYIWVIWYSKAKRCLHICILYSFNKVANFKKVPTLNKLPPLPSQKNWSAQDEYWLLLLHWLTISKFTVYIMVHLPILLLFIVLWQNTLTTVTTCTYWHTLAENGENWISTQPLISTHLTY